MEFAHVFFKLNLRLLLSIMNGMTPGKMGNMPENGQFSDSAIGFMTNIPVLLPTFRIYY